MVVLDVGGRCVSYLLLAPQAGQQHVLCPTMTPAKRALFCQTQLLTLFIAGTARGSLTFLKDLWRSLWFVSWAELLTRGNC